MSEANREELPPVSQVQQTNWSQLFPKLKEEDVRADIKVILKKLQGYSRLSDGIDLEQLEDFMVWLYDHKDETPIRYTGKGPYSYFLDLLSQRVA